MRARGVELPSFYDAHYRCQMEVLRFDSSRPNPRYRQWMDACRSHLQDVPIICREATDGDTADEGAKAEIAYNGSLSSINLAAIPDMAT